MPLLIAMGFGLFMIFLGMIFIFFPSVIDDLSTWTSQVVINMETHMEKLRRPLGLLLVILGLLLIRVAWIAQTGFQF